VARIDSIAELDIACVLLLQLLFSLFSRTLIGFFRGLLFQAPSRTLLGLVSLHRSDSTSKIGRR